MTGYELLEILIDLPNEQLNLPIHINFFTHESKDLVDISVIDIKDETILVVL